ncbi:MAG TPA: Fe-S cluster assembly protein IscX [Terriglobales bacterium]|nr:Fe-S cluster assembly protein IscX [Terriglobales bacterium]
MADELNWDDADEIAQLLRARFPDTDPLQVSELEIARWAREIPTLIESPGPQERFAAQLEAIRDAWART